MNNQKTELEKLLGWWIADAQIINFRRQEIKLLNEIDSPSKEDASMKSNIKNLYHRNDGRWEYSKIRNGERIYFVASTKEEALKKIKELKDTLTTKRIKERKDTKQTVVGWAQYWLKTYKRNKSDGTKENYTSIINKHMTKFFKEMPLSKLTPAILQEFLNSLKPNSRTLDYAYLTLRQSLKQAYINDKTSRNFAETIIKPRRTKKHKKTALSLEEQEKFLQALKNHDADIQSFMIFSIIAGTRRKETCAFDLKDIDEKKNRIFIHGTKTEMSERKITVSTEFIQYLKNRPKSKPYFTRQPHYYSKKALEIFREAGIKDKSLHDLRHTCATNLHYLGYPDKERQMYLGHASIVMTNDIYTNLQEDIDESGLFKLYNNLYLKF